MLRISQPRLAITNQEVIFSVPPQPGSPAPLTFADPKPVPFDLPFGKCIFMDTTFLPGSVTFGLFGHTVELLPRTLIIDNQEQPWRSNLRIEVPEIAKPKH